MMEFAIVVTAGIFCQNHRIICSDEFLSQPEWIDQCEERNTIVLNSLIEKYEQQVWFDCIC